MPKAKHRQSDLNLEMDTASLNGEFRVLRMDDIRPYWRNPRAITDATVNALVHSIKEYGFQQPIVVDSENVIVIGHARYIALRRMNYWETAVLVTDLPDDKVKRLRVMDNRLSEMVDWDYGALAEELAEVDDELSHSFFPGVSPQEMDDIADDAPEPAKITQESVLELTCPSCWSSFDAKMVEGHLEVGGDRVG